MCENSAMVFSRRTARAAGAVVLGGLAVLAAGCGGGGSTAAMPSPPMPTVTMPTVTMPTVTPPMPPGADIRTEEFQAQPALARINADFAYSRGYWGQGVTVAVIDTNFYAEHAALSAQLTPQEFWFNALSNDRYCDGSMIRPCRRITNIYAADNHGTFVAGVVGAARDGVSVHGVAPSVRILPVQNGDDGGVPLPEPVLAHRHVISVGVPIINNSYEFTQTATVRLRHGGLLEENRYRVNIPLMIPLWTENDFVRASEIVAEHPRNDTEGFTDYVFVWASGNDGWHRGNRDYSVECLDANGEPIRDLNDDLAGCGMRIREERHQFLTLEDFISDAQFVGDPYGSADVSVWMAENGLGMNSPSYYTLIPAAREEFRYLQARWLVVAATDKPYPEEDEGIAFFSNGCGTVAMYWCLSAPGVDIVSSVPYGLNGQLANAYIEDQGTSYAAPIVSGALAVLKSRLDGMMPAPMPMEAVRALLLASARDLGEPGVDDIYGWGIVDLEKATTMSVEIAMASVAAPIAEARIELPPALSHMHPRLRNVEVAISVAGAHYNAPLSDFAATRAYAPAEGDAAVAMLDARPRTAGDGMLFVEIGGAHARAAGFRFRGGGQEWRILRSLCPECDRAAWREFNFLRKPGASESWDSPAPPFFARGENFAVLEMAGDGVSPFAATGIDEGYRQVGLRWRSSSTTGRGLSWLVEASEIVERGSFWGANFNALGEADTHTRQFRARTGGSISDRWSGFVEYEESFGEASGRGGLLRGVESMRARGWATGAEGRDLLTSGDSLRLRAGRRGRIVSGEARLAHHAVDDEACGFTCGFYGNLQNPPEFLLAGEQEVRARDTVLDLSGGGKWSAAIGYSAPLGRRVKWSAAVEHTQSAMDGSSMFWSGELRGEF